MILFESDYRYIPIIKEASTLNIPVISPINFNKFSSYNKASYGLFLHPVNSTHKKLFYLEIFLYFLNLFNLMSYLNTTPNVSAKSKVMDSQDYVNLYFFDGLFIRLKNIPKVKLRPIHIDFFSNKGLNKAQQRFWSFLSLRKRKKKRFISLYNIRKKK
jgi:hypothetical protein